MSMSEFSYLDIFKGATVLGCTMGEAIAVVDIIVDQQSFKTNLTRILSYPMKGIVGANAIAGSLVIANVAFDRIFNFK